MTPPLLEVEGLTVRFPTRDGLRLIVEDVTFDIAAGEAVGLVGESGSGKSTTARSIIRVFPQGTQFEGSIRFEGNDVLAMSGSHLRDFRARQVQMIFQDPKAHINPVRSVGDFLTEALRCHQELKTNAAEERVIELLEEVGVARARHRLRQYPHELSGGLLQRIMIAGALAMEPVLLIADEPTTALDVTTQADVIGLINRLRQERDMAVMFITHDLELATAFCDRTAVMYAGRIVEDQPTARLHVAPMHPYTAALFASRPDVTRASGRLPAIPGQPLAAAEAPDGCPFAPRCAYRIDACTTERPPLVMHEGGRSRCIRTDEIEDELRMPTAERAA